MRQLDKENENKNANRMMKMKWIEMPEAFRMQRTISPFD